MATRFINVYLPVNDSKFWLPQFLPVHHQFIQMTSFWIPHQSLVNPGLQEIKHKTPIIMARQMNPYITTQAALNTIGQMQSKTNSQESSPF